MKTLLALCVAFLAGLFIYLKQGTQIEIPATLNGDTHTATAVFDLTTVPIMPMREEVAIEPVIIEVEKTILTPLHIVQSFHSVKSKIITKSVLEAADEWQPTREALKYWVIEYRLDQIKRLKSEYVEDLLGEAAKEWPLYLGYKGTLYDSLEGSWPDEADVDRMWENEITRGYFMRALEAMHLASVADEQLWVALKRLQENYDIDEDGDWDVFRDADLQYTTYRQLRGELWSNEARWWAKLWRSGDPSGYPHWPFLMTVADLHLN